MSDPQPTPELLETVPSTTGNLSDMARDLAKVQAALAEDPVSKDKTASVRMKSGGTYSFTYASLAGILSSLLPVLSSNGIAIVQIPVSNPKEAGVRTVVAGESWTLDVVTSFGVQNIPAPQDAASFFSYARRYAILCIFGLAPDDEEDDGGRRAQESHERAREESRQAPQKRPTARDTGPADPTVIIGAFERFGIPEEALVAHAGMPLAKLDEAGKKLLRDALAALKRGEAPRDVLNAKALRVMYPPQDQAPTEDEAAVAPSEDPLGAEDLFGSDDTETNPYDED